MSIPPSPDDEFASVNPYAASEVDDISFVPLRASGNLFTPTAVGIATFCGSMFAGGVVLALNYSRLNQKGLALQALLWSFLATVLFVSLIMFLPDFPGDTIVYTGTQILVMYNLTLRLQGENLADHIHEGGKLASNWWGVLIGLLAAVVLFGALFGVLVLWEGFSLVGVELDSGF